MMKWMTEKLSYPTTQDTVLQWSMFPNMQDILDICSIEKHLRNDKMSLAAAIACDLYVAVPQSLKSTHLRGLPKPYLEGNVVLLATWFLSAGLQPT